MKKETHPQYYKKAKIVCSCGNVRETGSTKEKMEVEICSSCHPFFTGQEKLIDTAGRVEKFKTRREKAATIKSRASSKDKKAQAKKTAK